MKLQTLVLTCNLENLMHPRAKERPRFGYLWLLSAPDFAPMGDNSAQVTRRTQGFIGGGGIFPSVSGASEQHNGSRSVPL